MIKMVYLHTNKKKGYSFHAQRTKNKQLQPVVIVFFQFVSWVVTRSSSVVLVTNLLAGGKVWLR